ncbi:hypothetical protein [Streptomyces sp. NPDC004286]|uniref:hypothetical protein n=1 Tax=Streptomyces sp. NPDC004286 TaxID=3364696 RepID=UPI0036C45963
MGTHGDGGGGAAAGLQRAQVLLRLLQLGFELGDALFGFVLGVVGLAPGGEVVEVAADAGGLVSDGGEPVVRRPGEQVLDPVAVGRFA